MGGLRLFGALLRGKLWLPLLRKIYAALPEPVRALAVTQRLAGCFLGERFWDDALYRTEVLLYPGLAVNLLYAAIQLFLGIFYCSVWAGALAVYYALLAVMRANLLKSMRQDGSTASQWRQYRRCGNILLSMTPIFASILILVVHKEGGARYPGVLIVVMAVYAVCAAVSAVSNTVRFRQYHQPAMSAAKMIRLIAALMSLLSLSTALVARLGDGGSAVLRQGIIGTASGGVCVVVLTMAICMVAHSSRYTGRRNSEIRGNTKDEHFR